MRSLKINESAGHRNEWAANFLACVSYDSYWYTLSCMHQMIHIATVFISHALVQHTGKHNCMFLHYSLIWRYFFLKSSLLFQTQIDVTDYIWRTIFFDPEIVSAQRISTLVGSNLHHRKPPACITGSCGSSRSVWQQCGSQHEK